jgi:hypothetical protein
VEITKCKIPELLNIAPQVKSRDVLPELHKKLPSYWNADLEYGKPVETSSQVRFNNYFSVRLHDRLEREKMELWRKKERSCETNAINKQLPHLLTRNMRNGKYFLI